MQMLDKSHLSFLFPSFLFTFAMPTDSNDYWSSEDIFNALSRHPLEVECSFIVQGEQRTGQDSSGADSSVLRNHGSCRLTLKENDHQTINLQDGSNSSGIHLLFTSCTTSVSDSRSCVRTIQVSFDHSSIQTDDSVILSLESLSASIGISFVGKTVMTNGYQSWSTSFAGADESSVFERPNRFYHELTRLGLASDMHIFQYPGGMGRVHSNLVTVIRDKCLDPSSPHTVRRPEEAVLCGSLSENDGFTYFLMDMAQSRLTIAQDCVGKKVIEA